jgi:predicted transcriptional regulator
LFPIAHIEPGSRAMIEEENATSLEAHEWLKKTRTLIANRPRSVSLQDLAEVAGASEAWIKKMTRGEIKDPSVNKVGAIFDFLTKGVKDV